jgi:hypothetical protein
MEKVMDVKFKQWLEQQYYSKIKVWDDYYFRRTTILYETHKSKVETRKWIGSKVQKYTLDDLINNPTIGWSDSI